MTRSKLDPYHKWLGISPKDQPANHYRLLGVDLYETDPDVIESAAARQISHVRSFSLGPHAELSQTVLNELAKARSTLLNPQTKVAYDQQLKQSLKPRVDTQTKQKIKTAPIVNASPNSLQRSRPTRSKTTSRIQSRKSKSTKTPIRLYATCFLILTLLPILFLIWRANGSKKQSSGLADSSTSVPVPDPSPAASKPVGAQPGPSKNESSLDRSNLKRPQETTPAPTISPKQSPPSTSPATPAVEPAEMASANAADRLKQNHPPASSMTVPKPANQTAKSSEAEWINLFNGQDLRGWYGGQQNDGRKVSENRRNQQWSVVDGELRWAGNRPDIDLFTEEEFRDFELSVEWKLPREGDSGILLRGYPQVQIWDPSSRRKPMAAVGSGGLYNNKQNPSTPSTKADRAAGQWNHFFIRMVGNRVTVFLNNQRVVNSVEMENFRNRDRPIPAKGPIGLQGHSQSVTFRNIRIRKLDAKELDANAALDGSPYDGPTISNLVSKPAPTIVSASELNAGVIDSSPWVSPDGLSIYWCREGTPNVTSTIWTGDRQSINHSFANLRPILEGRLLTLSGDELEIIYVAGNGQLFSAQRRSPTHNFNHAKRILNSSNLNTPKSPWMSNDGKTLLLNAVVLDDQGLRTVTIFECARFSRSRPWSAPKRLIVNENVTAPTWPSLTPDGLTLFISDGGNKQSVLMTGNRTRRNAGFDTPFKNISVNNQLVYGRSPRYVEATNELWYTTCPNPDKNEWEIRMIKNYDPS